MQQFSQLNDIEILIDGTPLASSDSGISESNAQEELHCTVTTVTTTNSITTAHLAAISEEGPPQPPATPASQSSLSTVGEAKQLQKRSLPTEPRAEIKKRRGRPRKRRAEEREDDAEPEEEEGPEERPGCADDNAEPMEEEEAEIDDNNSQHHRGEQTDEEVAPEEDEALMGGTEETAAEMRKTTKQNATITTKAEPVAKRMRCERSVAARDVVICSECGRKWMLADFGQFLEHKIARCQQVNININQKRIHSNCALQNSASSSPLGLDELMAVSNGNGRSPPHTAPLAEQHSFSDQSDLLYPCRHLGRMALKSRHEMVCWI